MIKTPNKLGMERDFVNMIRDMYENSSSHPYWWKFGCFLPKIMNKMSALSTFVLEVLTTTIKQKYEIKRSRLERKKGKWFPFADIMILCTENSKESEET
jgi:hypothetical protein